MKQRWAHSAFAPQNRLWSHSIQNTRERERGRNGGKQRKLDKVILYKMPLCITLAENVQDI